MTLQEHLKGDQCKQEAPELNSELRGEGCECLHTCDFLVYTHTHTETHISEVLENDNATLAVFPLKVTEGPESVSVQICFLVSGVLPTPPSLVCVWLERIPQISAI